jgi:hypothetical protein
MVHGGLNDLYLPFSQRSANQRVDDRTLCAALVQVRDRARCSGLQVYAGTLTPTAGSTGTFDYFSVTGEAHRTAVNQWLRHHADFDAALRDSIRAITCIPTTAAMPRWRT